MRLVVAADCHNNWSNLRSLIEKESHSDYLLFAGDLVGVEGLDILASFAGEVIMVWGNNERNYIEYEERVGRFANVMLAGNEFSGDLAGSSIFMNHFPQVSREAAESRQYDLAINGHTHRFGLVEVGQCQLLNPGELQGYRTGMATYATYDTKTHDVAVRELG